MIEKGRLYKLNIMNKKILLGASLFLFLGIALFIPQTQAAEVPARIVLSVQEKAALEQSLVALTAVLSNLQTTLEQNKALPQNSDQIVIALSDINKSLAKINVSIDAKTLAVASDGIEVLNNFSPKPLIVEKQKAEQVVKQSENNDLAQTETAAEAGNDLSASASEESGSLMANIRSLFNFKVGAFLGILLLIGVATFMMRGKKDVSQSDVKNNNQLVKA